MFSVRKAGSRREALVASFNSWLPAWRGSWADGAAYGRSNPCTLKYGAWRDEDIEPAGSFSLHLPGTSEPITVEYYKYQNKKGVDAYLLKDVNRNGKTFYTRKRYYYHSEEGYPTEEEFSNFFNIACLALIAKLEKKNRTG